MSITGPELLVIGLMLMAFYAGVWFFLLRKEGRGQR